VVTEVDARRNNYTSNYYGDMTRRKHQAQQQSKSKGGSPIFGRKRGGCVREKCDFFSAEYRKHL